MKNEFFIKIVLCSVAWWSERLNIVLQVASSTSGWVRSFHPFGVNKMSNKMAWELNTKCLALG